MSDQSHDESPVPDDMRTRQQTGEQNQAQARYGTAARIMNAQLTGTTTKECNCHAGNHMGRRETRCYNRSQSSIFVASSVNVNPRFAGLRGRDCLSGEAFVDEDIE